MSGPRDPFRTLDDPEPDPVPTPAPAATPKDPFRTLDDPEPDLFTRPITAGEITAGTITTSQVRIGALYASGYWVFPDSGPSWLRRLLVWLVLGWKWHV